MLKNDLYIFLSTYTKGLHEKAAKSLVRCSPDARKAVGEHRSS